MRLLAKVSLLAGLTAGLGTGCGVLLGLDDFHESGGTGGSGSASSSVATGTGGATGSGGASASSGTDGSTSAGTGGMIDCNAGETIAAVQSSPTEITALGLGAYWANVGDGNIMQWKEGGLPSSYYLAAVNGPEHVGANSKQACWADTNNSSVDCYYPSPPKPHLKNLDFGGASQPTSLVIDETYAYWTYSGSGEVKKRALPNGNLADPSTIIIVASGQGYPSRIAVDTDGRAYWANITDKTIMNIAPNDVAPAVVAMNQPSLSGLAVDADDIFWSSSTEKTVFKAPKLTGTPITTVASNQLYPEQVAVDATHVYWWNQGDGTIMKAPKTGGAATVIICGQTDVHFAVSATHVYWTDRKKGTVKRIPK